jgi:hypothetical protein
VPEAYEIRAMLGHRLAKKYLGLDRFPYLQPGEERIQVIVEPRRATYQSQKRTFVIHHNGERRR